jgi:hypothetical protein
MVGAFLVAFTVLSAGVVTGQGVWSGFANAPRSVLDFSCPNSTVITGVASEFR